MKKTIIGKNTIIVLTALVTIGFLANNAFAWGHGYGNKRGGCPGYGSGQGYGALADLTAEQKTELNTLRQKYIDETYETRSAIMTKKQEIRMLLETSTPDRAKLETLSDEISDLKRTMQGKRIDFILEAKKIAPELNLAGFSHHRGKGKWGKGGSGPCTWDDTDQDMNR